MMRLEGYPRETGGWVEASFRYDYFVTDAIWASVSWRGDRAEAAVHRLPFSFVQRVTGRLFMDDPRPEDAGQIGEIEWDCGGQSRAMARAWVESHDPGWAERLERRKLAQRIGG